MDLDVLFLSRFQFALTIMFHYLFPPLSIGLGVILAVTEGIYLKTRNRQYESLARFWTKIFAVVFAMGVATGIVMEFEFGTNWATYSRYVGDVFGSPLAAEGVFAFFLESGFLAVLVFGWDRVSPRMHFFSTIMVALGSMFSAVWIVVANSWQQTPTGFHIVGEGMKARAEITDFWAMVFNPSSVDRLLHTLIGAFILGAFFVMSITAWYLLKRRHVEPAKKSFTIALVIGTIASLAALFSGHHQANTVAVTQPAKLAAFEGHFHTGPGDMWLFGVPDEMEERVDMGISIPGGLSFLLHGDFEAEVTGLDAYAPEDRPPVQIPFQMYHIMIALGMYFIGITLLASYFRWRGTLFEKRWMLWIFVFSIIGPYIANQAGWVAAEVGRQPWIVYGLLRTSDALSKAVSAEEVLTSIILFSIIYLFLFAIWLYIMHDKITKGPEEVTVDADGSAALLDAVSSRTDAGGPSMTDARSTSSSKED
ncbi:MAG: cytochrome ubiquinol oxidase subunit I [Ignavibacteria bacterium]|nr:MAG: cytochrome ubiquinol oxidase subunit I [Ignavibacteria bacterium]